MRESYVKSSAEAVNYLDAPLVQAKHAFVVSFPLTQIQVHFAFLHLQNGNHALVRSRHGVSSPRQTKSNLHFDIFRHVTIKNEERLCGSEWLNDLLGESPNLFFGFQLLGTIN